METEEFNTVGAWYKKKKADGYIVPLPLYHTLVKLMNDKRISFQDAYNGLECQGRIKIINKNIMFNLNKE